MSFEVTGPAFSYLGIRKLAFLEFSFVKNYSLIVLDLLRCSVNTTARMESMGVKNRIHVSKDTADLLSQAGKGHWLKPRRDIITPKGKSPMQTYFLEAPILNTPASAAGSESGEASSFGGEEDAIWGDAEVAATKFERLIDWQVDIFTQLLKQIVTRRSALGLSDCDGFVGSSLWEMEPGHTCLDEVKEIITLPEFDAEAASDQQDPDTVVLGNEVTQQLRTYISNIAHMYRSNDFHNVSSRKRLMKDLCCPSLKLINHLVSSHYLKWEHGES